MPLYDVVEKVQLRQCIVCDEEKPLTEFHKHIANKDRLDRRCKKCMSDQSKLRKLLRAMAPTPTGICDCTGEVAEKIVLDHCHDKKVLRGWISEDCNLAIGLLGDNVEGVVKALEYMLRAESWYITTDALSETIDDIITRLTKLKEGRLDGRYVQGYHSLDNADKEECARRREGLLAFYSEQGVVVSS